MGTNLLYSWIKDHIRSLKLQFALQEWWIFLVLLVSVFHEILEGAEDAVEKSIKHCFIKILDVMLPHRRLFISL